MSGYDQLLTLAWPPEFVVEYVDGRREQLLSGGGVCLIPPADDPDGTGSLSADLPRKHPRNRQIGRYVQFSELRAVLALDGSKVWPDDEVGDKPQAEASGGRYAPVKGHCRQSESLR